MPHLLRILRFGDTIVIDHCHYNGKYRGAAHRKCNLQYAIPHYILIIFHNLSGYDAHIFVRELGKKFDSGSIGDLLGTQWVENHQIAENKGRCFKLLERSSNC